MKFYSFFLSSVLVIAPVYSYAFLPVAVNIGTAIAGSKAGKVAIANGTGAVIKTISPTAKQGLIKNAIALCKANVLAMKACSDILGDMLDDDVHIENKTTVNNDIDIEIYKKRKQDGCEVEHRYRVYNAGINLDRVASSVSQARSIASGAVSADVAKSGYSLGELSGNDKTSSMIKRFVEFVSTAKFTSEQPYKRYELNEERLRYLDTKGVDKGYVPYSFIIEYRVVCWAKDDKDYLSDDEIEEYFNKRADGDDITNIYNYDYSKHDNITVNNKTESGDTINNYKNDFDKNETEKNVSANATEKMKSKRKGYDVDDINDENCDKNEAGEYDKCGDDRSKKDGEDSEEPKKEDEEKKDDEKKEDDEEDKPIDCKASSFHKKVCDWIDWTKEKHNPKSDTKVDVDEPDLPNIDEDRIKFKAVCPPPKHIHINVVGMDYHTELSYQPLCDFFTELKPFVVGLGWFSGAMIIAGRRY